MVYRCNNPGLSPRRPKTNKGIQDTLWQSEASLYSDLLALFFVGGRLTGAQDDSTNIRVNVDLVQLNVAVTDNKGN